MWLPFVDSDLLYRGGLYGSFDCILLIYYTKVYADSWGIVFTRAFWEKKSSITINVFLMYLQWNLSKLDTLLDNFFVYNRHVFR